MIINGEKYACEACVRGHRVSSCSHQDRKLLHVNKKGRPVSQCPHCRSLRKNRAQHVKCECHDKSHAKEDCPHLKDLQQEGPEGSPPSSNVCCCGHGNRCTCSLKKETYLESVPEDFTQILQHQKDLLKPKGPNVNQHDSKPTVFANGHHKPVHKFNDAHNHCGAPYRIPQRSNSHHNHRDIAQRSSDSLPLTNKPAVHHESPLHNVLNASQPLRQARSEHNSPLLTPTSVPNMPQFQVEIPPLSPNAYSYSPFDSHTPALQPAQHFPDDIPDEWFTTHAEAHSNGPPNVPQLLHIDWARYGFPQASPSLDNPSTMKSIYSGLANNQVPSYATSMDHLNQPSSGFNTSSGEVSEVEDMPVNFRPSTLRTISHNSNDHSSIGATDNDDQSHRLSSASSYYGTPAGNALANNLEDLDIDKFIKECSQPNMQHQNPGTFQSPQSMSTELSHQPFQQTYQQYSQPVMQQPTPPQSQYTISTPPESIRGFSITSHPSPEESSEQYTAYSIREAQARAHLSQRNNLSLKEQPQMMSNVATFNDPMWCQPDLDQFGENRQFSLDDDREDEQWAR